MHAGQPGQLALVALESWSSIAAVLLCFALVVVLVCTCTRGVRGDGQDGGLNQAENLLHRQLCAVHIPTMLSADSNHLVEVE